jgi:hypothetical protein
VSKRQEKRDTKINMSPTQPKSSWKNIFKDLEFWFILLFNLLILYAYFYHNAPAGEIILLYYVQSVAIGAQSFIRLVVYGKRLKVGSFGAR